MKILHILDHSLSHHSRYTPVILTSPKHIEELLLDYGLAKAMEETIEDEELDIESAKKIVGF